MSAADAPGTISLKVEQARPITEALKGNRGKKRRVASIGGSSEFASSVEEASDQELPQQSKCLSSTESSCPSVDTDVDSDIEATPDSVLKTVVSVHSTRMAPGKARATWSTLAASRRTL